jgi:hypothetical protein
LLHNKERENWIKNDVEIKTALAKKRGEDAMPAIKLKQEDIRTTAMLGLTTSQPPKQI